MTTIFGSGSPVPVNFAVNQGSANAYRPDAPPQSPGRFEEGDQVSLSPEALSLAAQNEPLVENTTIDGGIGDDPSPPIDPDV